MGLVVLILKSAFVVLLKIINLSNKNTIYKVKKGWKCAYGLCALDKRKQT